ncbi:DUF1269 domain-containing protein, partial [Lacticaseibacillus rhamnosus]
AASRALGKVAVDESFKNSINDQMRPNSSAVILRVSNVENPEKIAERLKGFGGTVLHTNLSAETEKQLQDVLEVLQIRAGQPVEFAAPVGHVVVTGVGVVVRHPEDQVVGGRGRVGGQPDGGAGGVGLRHRGLLRVRHAADLELAIARLVERPSRFLEQKIDEVVAGLGLGVVVRVGLRGRRLLRRGDLGAQALQLLGARILVREQHREVFVLLTQARFERSQLLRRLRRSLRGSRQGGRIKREAGCG